MTPGNWKHKIWIATKVTLCGLSIAAIAWVVGVFDISGQVAESQADLIWLSNAPRNNTAQFMEALDRLGHDKPQMYEINGNLTYFSTNYSDRDPIEIMRQYQDEFVHQGINDRSYYSIPSDTEQMLVTSLTGGVVPIAISKNHIALGGMITQNKARSRDDLKKLAQSRTSPQETFRGHRYIEINRDPGSRFSSITSSWSDEEFDYRKMIPGNTAGPQNPDPEVPACPGCVRVNRFVDLETDRNYQSNIFAGPMDSQQVYRFYNDALARRGWTRTESASMLSEVRKYAEFVGDDVELLQFSRDGEFLTLFAYPEDGETTVFTVKSN